MKTQPIVSDLGSEVVRQLYAQVNALNTIVDALFVAIAASTDASGIKTGAAAIDRTAQLQLKYTRNVPRPREFPQQ
jgi:hypothetical protein